MTHWILWGPFAAASLALFWIVPVIPGSDVTDPTQWGVGGFIVAMLLLLRRDARSTPAYPRRLLAVFLAAMPLVYLASWFRHGGPTMWLATEVAGVLAFVAVAWLGYRGKLWLLPTGVAAHGLWDVSHWGSVEFIPSWYALACLVADVAIGGYAAGKLAMLRGSEGP